MPRSAFSSSARAADASGVRLHGSLGPLLRALGLAWTLLFMAGLPGPARAAAWATGGSSPYRSQILWLTWGQAGA